VPYLSASAVVIHYEEALYQVYGPLPLTFHALKWSDAADTQSNNRRLSKNSASKVAALPDGA